LLGALAINSLPSSAAADWPVFDHDSARSGNAVGDNAISLANAGSLHRRGVATFDAAADGAPILASIVRISPDAHSGHRMEAPLAPSLLVARATRRSVR
jgi:hypothetical protein